MSRNSVLVLLLCAGALTGCAADYLNNYDSVTLAAGDTQKFNSLLQTVDPLNPNSKNTTIEGDGERAVGAVRSYRVPPPPAPTTNMTVNVGGSGVTNGAN
ncbi:hypothetical protein EN858_29450 [Mesorhizobium sp. M4B.F.Ca.ET.215.01.1.1]|uniref:hypothetical protein n=1 Tax=unclassified Mesorhizobium TaxID=325217 RepID=UPI000FCC723A|nr:MULTISPECIES: hypothetical protein [unclassified Mesorhizobium]RUW25010.1 hypothetical protein EOA34_13155 [Mesorhizobium sp. M4B.F.Ca.ET.013.02.1.1]RVD36995.1 hypothetical protein EN741_24405 [Mesorhizobium sp. M4B.F.Ca.ET.019.03.1.1]TGQ05402.1 hypothetical protein EN858_29450 [Mesorhizobium sp. M4B.F.Ca.ET.215.01.1.1]TGQ31406.1 hypothetical protein EN863_039595 [Mesorhizobium sp. M00.F.Ca.ET.220.01.1.1]TGQ98257.1 hypothetical protein EN846_27090 [Mesorhizobium sp. M4B.F.Ca.ET.203.01.1.1]